MTKSIRILFLFHLTISIIVCCLMSCLDSSDSKESDDYSEYITDNNLIIDSMPRLELKSRDSLISNLKKNPLYELLVDSQIVDPKYLVIFNAISHGIANIDSAGFSFTESIIRPVLLLDDANQGQQFVANIVALAQPRKGGITPEILNVFGRYKNVFGYYGTPHTIYDRNGSEKYVVDVNYDLTPIFGVVKKNNPHTIDAVLDAKSVNVVGWQRTQNRTFPYLTNVDNYLKMLMDKAPESKHLPKGYDAEFWNRYSPDVRMRVLKNVLLKNCAALQSEFDIADQNNELTRLRTGRSNVELMEFIDKATRKIGCYE